jgi:hypothetical protein
MESALYLLTPVLTLIEAPKSTGGRQAYMNGAVISAPAQRHTTAGTPTTEAELTECFKCGKDVMGFRNLMEQVGLMNGEPALIYQDNTPGSDPGLESEVVMCTTTFQLLELVAGCRITPVSVFWTGRALYWVKFTFETGFELSSSWRDLPCYGANLNRNILDFMK